MYTFVHDIRRVKTHMPGATSDGKQKRIRFCDLDWFY